MPTREKRAGFFLIVRGLNVWGVLNIPWLYRTSPSGGARRTSRVGAFKIA